MTVRRAAQVRFSPSTLSDSLDATESLPGVMASLQNLIPDPSTKNLWQCRPAATKITAFLSFLNAGFISCSTIIGNRVYGMIATSRFANYDEPFCYDLKTSSFIPISGVTTTNVPFSPAASGDWIPPTMALIGVYLVVTHSGFSGTGTNFFGVINTSNPNALAWNSQNTTGYPLVAVPVAVAQFYGRAYFLANPPTGQPSAAYTDVLTLNMTQGTQVLTFGDNVKLTALKPLQLSNQLGGIVQGLIVFKGSTNMYQITGDAVGASLAVNSLSAATGSDAPNTIVNTPKGLVFVAPDGVRLITSAGTVSPPLGVAGSGVNVPFLAALYPSRMVAAASASVVRFSLQNGKKSGTPFEEYWYDMNREVWSGPHTFPSSQIKAYGSTFITCPVGVTGTLFQSDAVQSPVSTFTENGAPLFWEYRTSFLLDPGEMNEYALGETTLEMALASGSSAVNCSMFDYDETILASMSYNTGSSGVYWGGFVWGSAQWLGAVNALKPRRIDWSHPVVFRRAAFRAYSNSYAGVKVGALYMRQEVLGYLQQGS